MPSIKRFSGFIFKLLFPKREKEIEMLRASIEEAQKKLLEKNMKIQILSEAVEILKTRITNLEQSADESRNFKSAAIDFFQNSILKDQIASLPEFLSKLEKNKLNGAVISGANSGGLPPNVKLLKGSFKSDSDKELIDYMATRFSKIATDEQIGAGILATLLNDGEKMMSDSNHGQTIVADHPYLVGSAGKFGGAGGNGSFDPEDKKKAAAGSIGSSIFSYQETAKPGNGYIEALFADTPTLKKDPLPETLCTSDQEQMQEVPEQGVEKNHEVEAVSECRSNIEIDGAEGSGSQEDSKTSDTQETYIDTGSSDSGSSFSSD